MLKSFSQLVAFVAATSSFLPASTLAQRPSLCTSEGASTFDAAMLNFSVVAVVEPLTPGFAILEGPVWYDGRLYMSHIGYSDGVAQAPSDIIVLNEDNEIEVHRNNSGTNGLVLTKRNEIVAAMQGRAGEPGRVAVIDLDSEREYVLSQEFAGLPYNSPNDVAVSSRFHTYFTDPDWQSPNTATMDPPQDAERTYYLLAGDFEATPIGVGTIEKPNGVLLSADESQLYVGGLNGLYVFPVSCSGAVTDTPVQLHAEVMPSGVDGMVRDCAGNVYVTAGGVVHVLERDTEEILASVELTDVTNLAFGGDDLTTLYATSLGGNPTLYSSPSAISGENLDALRRSRGGLGLLQNGEDNGGGCCGDAGEGEGEGEMTSPPTEDVEGNSTSAASVRSRSFAFASSAVAAVFALLSK